MTISSSLNAGVAGLAANASKLATISDNIANSSTYGYKRAVTDFHSIVIDSGKGTYSAGGVRVTSQRLIDERGPLVSTANPTDLAVRGGGFLPVTTLNDIGVGNGEMPLRLTSTGSFRTNSEGYLTTSSGLALLGWPIENNGVVPTYPRDTIGGLEPVQINTFQFAGNPTQNLNLAVNLPATATQAGAAGDDEKLSIEYWDSLGLLKTLDVTFTPTVPATGSANEWTMTLSDSASGGTVVGEYVMTFDASQANGGRLLSVSTTSGGAYDPVTGQLNVTTATGPLNVSIGTPGAEGGMSQLSDVFTPVNIDKDGSPVGKMTSIEVDSNGFVNAFFDNGIAREVYQIPLVDVPNPNGLYSEDQQTYSITSESGPFFLWDAGDGPTGDLVSYAREESATDVAAELTQLIQTQRAYSSNAKVIQTVDEMLQETTNIKR